MSLKDLFNENKNLKSFEPVSKEDFKDETESFDYANAIRQRDARFVATEGFDDPSAFARFGSAEKYYEDSIKRIYNTYPYDGSLKEKVLWEVSSSLIDLHIFENGYPRTNGYANFTVAPDTTGGDSGYFPSSGDDEYILIKGGPHAGTGDSLYYDYIINNVVYRKDANIYDLSENRENNLLIDGEKGNTVEFWLKKTAFVNQKETIFDVAVTGTVTSSADYARLTVGLDTASVDGPFEITYQSGTAGLKVANIGSSLTTANIADDNWHHYAVRMKNTGSNIVVDLFVDGQHNERITSGTTINYVSGALVGTVGALVDTPSGSFTTTPERGWAKLSGSLDEFRYWKTFRTSKKIQRYWFDQVGGGTNTDTSNTHLGVYYKFNEGITGDSSIDSVALDYSGRISNGTWTGYASTSRSTNSAIIEASASTIEFKDPIIYSSHPDISTYLSNMQGSGSVYDDTNPNSMISFMPTWIIEQNETDNDLKDKNYLWNLLQIVSSYFDEAAILLDKLPQLSHKKYYSGVANPPPFNKKALESCGFIVPEIFINSNILEKFEDRDDEIKFASTLQEVKNTIYQNIYNNLDFIYKSKGTEKSFRNLFHCFGFGDNTLKFNIYANNAEYKLEDNLKFTSKIKNYINFNDINHSDAAVYQYKIDSDATSYISGTSAIDGTYEGAGLAFTLESNVILPNRVTEAEYRTVKHQYEGKIANLYPLVANSSLFGIHTATGSENDLTWDTDDYANFEVTTVKDDKYSSNAYFKLTGTAGGFIPELTSSLFEDVYDDQLWTVSVTVEPTKYPLVNQISGTSGSTDTNYTVRFYGVNYIADYKAQEFLVTGTMTNDQGRKFLSSHKRTYVGAHRTNFTGSVLKFADTKINSCKAWMTSIPTGTIDKHNLKIGNYGPQSSTQNAFLYQDSINGLNVPEIQTLALLWDFSNVTGSNTNGQFAVEDETSGSATDDRFGWFSDVVSRRHTASGSFFDASATNVVQSLDRGTYQAQVPEVLLDSNLTRILSEDDEFFNRNTKPVKYHMSIEKNLFQDISEEMLNMFGSVVWFNKMIGEPVNVYRGEYKELKKAADLFFEKVDNDYDFDKYVEYFKFIDYALSRYIMKLVPASLSTFKDGISTVIENFVLGDRNKFQSKYPIIKDVRPKEIIGEALGINELLYDWKRGAGTLWKPNLAITGAAISSLYFDGTTDYVTIDNSDLNYTPDTDARSWSIWFKRASGQTGLEYIFEHGADQANCAKLTMVNGLLYYSNLDGTNIAVNGGVEYDDGAWHNVVMTIDPTDDGGDKGTQRVYIDGTLYATDNFTVATAFTGDIFVGADSPGNASEFIGNIDWFTYWTKTLSADEVTELYNDAKLFNLEDFSAYGDIKFWWKLGDDAAADSSGNGYAGTVNGAIASTETPDYEGRTAKRNNCLWLDERTERSQLLITSGDADVDSDRQQILDALINETNASAPTLAKSSSSGIETYEGSTYVTRRLAKPYKIRGANQPDIHGGGNSYQNKKIGFWDAIRQRPAPSGDPDGGLIIIEPADGSSLDSFKDCDDSLELSNLKGKRKYTFSVQTSIDSAEFSVDDKFKGDLIFPFSLYSSSLNNNSSRANVVDFQANLDITNLHHDSYGPFNDVPMQGPFTEKYVGGRAYRHVFTNFSARKDSLDTEGERLEGWILSASADSLSLKNPSSPKSVYFRDGTAKRPVNIANIQQLTGAKDTDDQYIHPLNATIIGNYSEGYEIVLTNGRSINNRYLAESDGTIPTGSADSSYVSGAVEFALPRRDLTGSNSCIIVNRFSAPGDPATMAEGMLDIEAGEYSVYNSLPWRNLSVRLPMNELLSDHSKQFGYFSDAFNSASYDLADVTYPGSSGSVTSANYDGNPPSASFHKVNRNRKKQIQYSNEFIGNKGTIATASVYDNAYVTHPIPRSDMQYAWITGNTENIIYGYEQKDLSLGDYASSDIQFVSASDIGGYASSPPSYRFGLTKAESIASGNPFLPIDFINLNTFVLENVTQSYGLQSLFVDGNNVLGNVDINYAVAAGDAYNSSFVSTIPASSWAPTVYLNSLLLHREGPYGGANWKLYRKDNHPIVRYQKNNNVIGYVSTLVAADKPYVINFVEPPITSKFKPLIYSAPSSVKDGVIKTLASHGNIRSHFTDHTKETDFTLPAGQIGVSTNNYWMKHLDVALPTGKSIHDIKKVTYSPYVSVKKYLEESKDMTKVQVVYTETIYPKGLHTYLSPNRKRLNFANNFWRDNRTNRSNLDLINSMNDSIQTASIWKLDAHLNFLTGASPVSHIPYSGGMPTKDGTGELQNCYSLFHYAGSAGGGDRSDIVPATNYNRRIKLIHRNYTDFDPSRPTVPWSELYDTREDLLVGGLFPLFSNLGISPNPARFSASVGDTFWEATSSLGAKPFYDSYDEYAEEGFRKLKDGTILPEFRISEKIDNYVSAGTSINYFDYNPKHFFNKEDTGDNLKIKTGLLSLTGSSVTDSNTDVNFFLQRYTFSDFHKYFKLVKEDYNVPSLLDTKSGMPIANVPTHKLVCNAILKFLPYDGFYPSERCVQLGELFSSSVEGVPGFPGHAITGDDGNFRTIMQPYFAPGILFNSIKSGIAVDYPIFNDADSFTSTGSLVWGTCISGNFDKRLNIDNLLNPDRKTIIDAEVDLDLALDSTGSIKTVSSKHTFAVSNFLAETMNTFVGRDNYSSIVSEPFDSSETIEVGKTGEYTMDIILRNSTNIVSEVDFATAKVQMYGYQVGFPSLTSSLQVNTSSITMYNRAITGYNIDPFLYGSSFGPPVHSGEISAYDVALSSELQYGTASGNPHGTSFDPYTPSYYNGYSKVILSINLVENTPYELEQIITNLTYSYDRLRTFSYALPAGSQANAGAAARETTAYRHAMQLSASLFLGDEKANNIIYERPFGDAPGPGAGLEEVGTLQVISFKPRWECPILDFSGTNPTLSFVSGNVAKGMWHQHGEIPIEKGVSLELQHNSGYDLAADVLNINKNQQTYIGKLNDASTFSEAIIAIPFKYNESLNITEFYKVNNDAVRHTINNLYWNEKDKLDPLAPVRTYKEIQKSSPAAYADESLYNLIQMMRKYVIPPHLDWAHNRDWMTNNMASVKPFTMFMIEYGINLDQKDIQNIWQNIEPTFARKALYVKSESNLHLLPVDINNAKTPYFNQDPFAEDNTRWAIFKVKKRAKTNYNAVVGKTFVSGQETLEYKRKDLKTKTGEFLYSYNWPYDFFSLIELAKIDSITTFNPIYDNIKDTS